MSKTHKGDSSLLIQALLDAKGPEFFTTFNPCIEIVGGAANLKVYWEIFTEDGDKYYLETTDDTIHSVTAGDMFTVEVPAAGKKILKFT